MASFAQQAALAAAENTTNNSSDPFVSTPVSRSGAASSNSSFYARGSPSQARRALEAHIADTDRRIRDASQLGTTLLTQKEQLLARLVEVEETAEADELTPELKQKLVDLEREYNEVGREAARASLHRGKRQSRDFTQELAGSARDGEEMSATGRTSPTKLSIPSASTSRKTTKHAHTSSSSQVKDLELATEISTSLLNEVRSLQGQLADKDDALKKAQKENTDLHTHTEALAQRFRNVDDNEQRYKDENWNLETQVQDLSNAIKEITAREEKLVHSLNVAKADKSSADREYEELRQTHGKLAEDHSGLKRQHDLELSSLRRNITDGEAEREKMQRHVEELTSQNQDLAKAVAYRVKNEPNGRDAEQPASHGARDDDLSTPEGSPPPSPSKLATPRHGGLESETLKSSLAHAHRMIQNLKNNIHREKTEKVELKRMLQQTQDDLEARRNDGTTAANAGRKRKPAPQDAFKKPANLSKLGGATGVSEEIIDDSPWEEYADAPVRKSIEKDEGYGLSTDASDAFETADEKNTTDDTDAFETAESLAGGSDDDDDLTETEGDARTPSGSMRTSSHRHRNSYQSTASDEDQFDMATPPASVPRYKMKLNRGLSRSITPGNRPSPAPSYMSNMSQPMTGQNLAAELEDMDDSSLASSTPARSVASSRFGKTPEPTDLSRRDTVVRSPLAAPARSVMVDSSMMTEPWKPESETLQTKVTEAGVTGIAGAAVGAALTSVFGTSSGQTASAQTVKEATPAPAPAPAPVLAFSALTSQSTAPVAPKIPVPASPRRVEAPRTPLAPKSPNIPSRTSSAVKPDDKPAPEFIPPPVSSISNSSKINPATQAFINDILAKAHARSKSSPQARSTPATPERNARTAYPPSGATSTPRRKTVTSDEGPSRPEGRPSFAISIEGREIATGDATPPDVGKRLNSLGSSPVSRNSLIRTRDYDDLQPSLHVHGSGKKDDGSFQEPILSFDSPVEDAPYRTPAAFGSSSATTTPSVVRAKEPASISRPAGTGMTESGTQTTVSGDQIDTLVKSSRKSLPSSPLAGLSTGSPRQTKTSGRAMSLGSTTDQTFLKSLKTRPIGGVGARRPGSPSLNLPPLPPDHKEVIAAAAASRSSSMLNMPSPNLQSSKFPQPPMQGMAAPRTPTSVANQVQMKSGNTPRNRTSSIARSEMSRRSSVSSFASELDVRFNIAAPNRSSQNLMGDGFDMGSNTDPRMIAAITQTMIGEFLYKYVRKTGRGEHSDNRHRRFFWIHPYTKTLYWSNQDPSISGRSELKAKSVQIEAVRVVTDENPNPPGVHQKSIVVVTPGRSIKFTAPTSYRHETWFNALSYLLLRSAPEAQENDVLNSSRNYSNVSGFPANPANDRTSTMGSTITQEDLAEFNPQPGYGRAGSRNSHRSTGTTRSSIYAVPTLGPPSAPASHRTSTPQGINAAPRASSVKRSSQLGSAPELSPLRSNPIAPISEDLASHRNSLRGDRPERFTADAPAEVDADGFKKPRPVSLARKSGGGDRSVESSAVASGAPAPAPAPGPTSDGAREGRFASLTSRLRRKSRSKIALDKDGKNGGTSSKAPPVPASTTNESGRLENVRACCDGKHDVGALHGHHHSHHTGSRHNSMTSRTSRTWSLGSRA